MYKMLWVPAVCAVLFAAIYFGIPGLDIGSTGLLIASICFVGAAVAVFSNTETTIEQPRYGIAIALSLIGLFLPLIIALINDGTVK